MPALSIHRSSPWDFILVELTESPTVIKHVISQWGSH